MELIISEIKLNVNTLTTNLEATNGNISTLSTKVDNIVNDLVLLKTNLETVSKTTNDTAQAITGGTIYNEMVNTNIGYGGKPPINEWDKYIINSNLKSKIVAGDNSMWHWNNNISTMCQDSLNIANATTLIKTLRGPYYYNGSTYGANKANYFSNSSLTATGTYMGFRPVLEYKEPTYKSTNLWY